MDTKKSDIAIVGAGIVGLALAYRYAQEGHTVRVFEKDPAARNASIRNFGLLWPIGQKSGMMYERAQLSASIWKEVAPQAKIHLKENGSLHLAYHSDEWQVLQEFYETTDYAQAHCQLLLPHQCQAKNPYIKPSGLMGGLWSPVEMTVDPRQALHQLPLFLAEKLGVDFQYGCAIQEVKKGALKSKAGHWEAEEIFVCTGADFEILFPQIFAKMGITKVKLLMMRSSEVTWELGPSLCGGLTLIHYDAFAHCAGLEALKKRFEAELPQYLEWGIHVLLAQNHRDELVIGDSHEYGWNPSPFDQEEVNQLILSYLNTFIEIPHLQIRERWHGIYPKLSGKTEFYYQIEPGLYILNALGGAGMTLSFGTSTEIYQGKLKPG
ncbi:MAG: TIGR03364 family FAD-dependent oxidoreductase [Bacteroidota bacterium]